MTEGRVRVLVLQTNWFPVKLRHVWKQTEEDNINRSHLSYTAMRKNKYTTWQLLTFSTYLNKQTFNPL